MKRKRRDEFLRLAEAYRGSAVPECPHFGRCGGCLLQDISYENQLLLKKEYLNTLFSGIAEVREVCPSIPFRYRNRMDMVTAFGRIGLRERGKYRSVVEIESCPLMQEKSESLYRKLRNLLKNIEGYDYQNHAGYLRYAVLRQTMFTGQSMASFVVAIEENRLADAIAKIMDDADSISILFNDGLADTSFGPVFETAKRGSIEEVFDGITYLITPNSFFQSNSLIARQIYRRIRDETEGRVLDLYSGVGSISLFVAGMAAHVIGVESVLEAVDAAVANRERNGIGNVEFICADARAYLREKRDAFDTLILDPPRSGMHPKMVKYLNESGPGIVIYMSCNPVLFAEEMKSLEKYSLTSLEAYDMFPQTPHLETLAVMRRK